MRIGQRIRDHGPAVIGAALVAGVAVLDALLGSGTVLIPLLVVGPLAAAVHSRAGATAVVAALAVAAAIPLGLVDAGGMFAGDHAVSVIAVALGSALAIVAAAARARSEETVRAERQLEAVLENLAEAVIVQAPDRSVTYANQAAAQTLECASPSEVVTTPPTELHQLFVILDESGHPLDLDRMPGRRALAGAEPEPILSRWVSRTTGDERWLLTKASVVRDDHGEIAMAVNIMEDVTEERRAARQQRFLATASALISSSLEIELTLEKLAWAVVPEVADWCCVDLPDDRGVLRRRALAADDARRPLLDKVRAAVRMDPDAPGSLAQVLRTGEPILIADVERELASVAPADATGLAALKASETRSLMCVPLRAGERLLGVITLATAQSRRRLTTEDLELAEDLGRRAGIAVENARLHEARTHVASTLQQSLLPRSLPALPGIASAARFRAAGDTVEVGGDFYDVFRAETGWMVVIGDVTGKGPTAAATTSLARYTMRTAAMYERSPSAVLERLNATLVADPEAYQLCTAVCVRLDVDPRDGVAATIACGGHPPPFLVRPDGAAPVGHAGPLLGAFDDATWRESHVVLHPGHSLVLYTDGVTDTRGDAGRFGADRLGALLGELATLAPDRLAARIDQALLDFEHGPQRDDVALLVLRADGAAAPDVSAG